MSVLCKTGDMTLAEKKASLIESISSQLKEKGIWQGTTCATGAGYGWDVLAHHALKQIQRNPPEGWHISSSYKFECTDWTIVQD
jgi:hypothetical protein